MVCTVFAADGNLLQEEKLAIWDIQDFFYYAVPVWVFADDRYGCSLIQTIRYSGIS